MVVLCLTMTVFAGLTWGASHVSSDNTAEYELIVDGLGVNSLEEIEFQGYDNIEPEFNEEGVLIGKYNDGKLLVGRNPNNQLYVSVVPRILILEEMDATTSPTFMRVKIQFINSIITSTENSLQYFNWPQVGDNDPWGTVGEVVHVSLWPVFDWVEEDAEHVHDLDRTLGEYVWDRKIPDWWWTRFKYLNSWCKEFPMGFSATSPRPVYDVLSVLNSNELLLETVASVGTDSFIINYEILRHPAYIVVIPLMDHEEYGCAPKVFVGRENNGKGVEYDFNEPIPLTRQFEYARVPAQVPIQAQAPIIPSPAPLAFDSPAFTTVTTITGIVTGVGISSVLLTIILNLQARPQALRGLVPRSRTKPKIVQHARHYASDMTQLLLPPSSSPGRQDPERTDANGAPNR
jgi:hypothetical protein